MYQPVSTAGPGRIGRRALLAGGAAICALALSGCATFERYSLVQAVRRLLELATQRAFARLMAPGGFWDSQLTRLPLPDILGSRGNIITQILVSAAVKEKLQHEFNRIAEKGAARAAPLVADAVRTIGIDNARAILDGGPSAATSFLRGAMAGSLVEAMVPEFGQALKVSQEPLVAQVLAKLTGVDVSAVARDFAGEVDNQIWNQIGFEEGAIRADPAATKDPILMAILGVH